MMRLSAVSVAFLLSVMIVPARAQLTETPGPGGIPIAPGAAPNGFTPGGKSFGGVDIAPGPAARDIPMYRQGPGDVPVIIAPEEPRKGKSKGRRKRNRGSALELSPHRRI